MTRTIVLPLWDFECCVPDWVRDQEKNNKHQTTKTRLFMLIKHQNKNQQASTNKNKAEQPGAPRTSQEQPRRAQESPGEPRRAQESPGEARRAQESPGEPRRAQERPGQPRTAQESPGEPRRAQETRPKAELRAKRVVNNMILRRFHYDPSIERSEELIRAKRVVLSIYKD